MRGGLGSWDLRGRWKRRWRGLARHLAQALQPRAHHAAADAQLACGLHLVAAVALPGLEQQGAQHVLLQADRKSTRLNSSHGYISYAVFCLKKKNTHLLQSSETQLILADALTLRWAPSLHAARA